MPDFLWVKIGGNGQNGPFRQGFETHGLILAVPSDFSEFFNFEKSENFFHRLCSGPFWGKGAVEEVGRGYLLLKEVM